MAEARLDTIVDRSFRDNIELNPEHFQLCNAAWSEEMTHIITLLGRDLGFPEGPSGMKAELYKLLLYEEGALFKPHIEYQIP